MTLYKIFKENKDKFEIVKDMFCDENISQQTFFYKLTQNDKQSQLALIDGVIAMVDYKIAIHKELEQQFVGSINAIKVNIREDNPHSFVIQNFEDLKDKLLAERKLIEENK